MVRWASNRNKSAERAAKEQRFRDACEIAREALKEQDLHVAYQGRDDARHIAGTFAKAKSEVDKLDQDIDTGVEQMLGEADQSVVNEQWRQAVFLYERVRTYCRNTQLATRARVAMMRLRKQPEVQAALREEEAASMLDEAVTLLEEARTEQLAKDGRSDTVAPDGEEECTFPMEEAVDVFTAMKLPLQAKLLGLLETIHADYAETETHGEADPLRTALRSDEELAGKIDQWQTDSAAKQLIDRARMFKAAGMTDKACACYKEVLTEHPKSCHCTTAEKELKELTTPKRDG